MTPKKNIVYRLSAMNGEGELIYAPSLAYGFETNTAKVPGTAAEAFLYRFVTNDEMAQRRFYAWPIGTPEDALEFEDAQAHFAGVTRVVYRLEPLTLARWAEMKLPEFDRLKDALITDADLQEFYAEDLDTPVEPDPSRPTQVQESSLYDVLKRRGFTPLSELLEGRKKFPVGTVRIWKSGPHKKERGGEWRKLGEVKDWVEHHPDLPTSTLALHFPGGEPTPERKQLHDDIRAEFFAKVKPVPPDKSPTVVITMGIPASGKSTTVATRLRHSEEHAVLIDPDRIKERLPEFQKAKDLKSRSAAAIVHEESQMLSESLRDEAISRRVNFVFDGLGWDSVYYGAMLKDLKSKGYSITLVYPHSENVEEAINRADARGYSTGRFVPIDRIRKVAPLIPESFGKIYGLADSFHVFRVNDDLGGVPEPMWEGRAGEGEVVYDEKAFARFKVSAKLTESAPQAKGLPRTPEFEPDQIVARYLEAARQDAEEAKSTDPKFTREQGIVYPVGP